MASGEPLTGAGSRVDPDDAPEWTDEMFGRAELCIGDTVIRRASLPGLGSPPASAKTPAGNQHLFLLKHKFRKELSLQKVALEAGSVLLMRGETQHFWKHGINKRKEPCGPKVNLTFRTLFV